LNEVTRAGDWIPPTRKVSINSIRTRSGDPVTVLCEPVREITLLNITKQLPGGSPHESNDQLAKRVMEYLGGSGVEHQMKVVRPVIENGTALELPDGSGHVRPGISFADNPPDGSIPGRYLSDADALEVFRVIMVCSGYIAEVDDVTFRDGDGGRVGDGVGGGGDRADRGDEAARSDEGPGQAEAGHNADTDGESVGATTD